MSEVYHERPVATQVGYRIRVSGRLDADTWSQWFEGMEVEVRGGETIISGPLPDQAAVYGTLARLRDMALPLLSVEEIDPVSIKVFREAWRERRHFNWSLAAAYLLFGGGLSALSIFLIVDAGLHTALGLGLLFAALAGLAVGCYGLDRGRGWLMLVPFWGLSSVIAFALYVMITGWLPVTLGLAGLSIFAGGVIMWLILRRQSYLDQQRHSLEAADNQIQYDRGR